MTDKDHALTTADLMLVMGVALGAGALVGAGTARRTVSPATRRPASRDDAPASAAKGALPAGYQVVKPAVTIAALPDEILGLWEDPGHRAAVLGEEIGHEVAADGTTAWRFGTGLNSIGPITTRMVNEREDRLLVWRSLDEEAADLEVKLHLAPAPGQRGTRVALLVASKRAGLARLLPDVTDPAARKALKRLKMLAETGEIATSANRRPA